MSYYSLWSRKILEKAACVNQLSQNRPKLNSVTKAIRKKNNNKINAKTAKPSTIKSLNPASQASIDRGLLSRCFVHSVTLLVEKPICWFILQNHLLHHLIFAFMFIIILTKVAFILIFFAVVVVTVIRFIANTLHLPSEPWDSVGDDLVPNNYAAKMSPYSLSKACLLLIQMPKGILQDNRQKISQRNETNPTS